MPGIDPENWAKLPTQFQAAIGALTLSGVLISMIIGCNPSASQECLKSLPGDSRSFGHALAVSEDYLAVGDPKANRVALYSRETNGKWLRIQDILPPEGSAADKVGFGFGYSLALDKNALIIGAYNERRRISDNRLQYSGAVYATSIDEKSVGMLRQIQVPKKNLVVGYALSVFGDQVAISGKTEVMPGKWSGSIFLVDLANNEIKTVIEAPIPETEELFGISVGLSQDSLIVGSPLDPPEGSAWLFNLTRANNPPRRIEGRAGANAFAGGAVGQGEGFVAVSTVGGWGTLRTLIMTEKAVPIVLETGGTMSTSGRLLSLAEPPTPDHERTAKVSVFDIERLGEARLILEIPQALQGALTRGFLAFIIEIEGKRRVCYRSLEVN